jgi:hypothetical protein
MASSDLSGLNLWKKTAVSFNGDIILCAIRPSGGIHILLADCMADVLHCSVCRMELDQVSKLLPLWNGACLI